MYKRKSMKLVIGALSFNLLMGSFLPVLATEEIDNQENQIIPISENEEIELEEIQDVEEVIDEDINETEESLEDVIEESTVETNIAEESEELEEVEEIPEIETIEENTILPQENESEIVEVLEESSEIQEDIEPETVLPDFPIYNHDETYDWAIEIMNQDINSKNSPAKLARFSTGISYVDTFLNKVKPYAIEGSVTSGILPSIVMAQGALESAWGQSLLALEANNFYGIKVSNDWKGQVYNVITSEYSAPVKDKNGKIIKEGYWYKVVAPFRKYNNISESIKDHSAFFTSTEWRKQNYKAVIGEKNYRKAAYALQNAGYATDPNYAEKLIKVIEEYNLDKYDNLPVLSAEYHIQNLGWQKKIGTSVSLGTIGSALRLEDLKLSFPSNDNVGITYSAHIQNRGWVNNISENNTTNNTGKSMRLEALKLNLIGTDEKYYDIFYRTYSETLGWSGWAKNGQAAGSEGFGKKIYSVQIIIALKGENPIVVSNNALKVYFNPVLYYKAHVENNGWMATVSQGGISGTVGQSKRLEAIQIILQSTPFNGTIEYQTHVQSIGWTSKVTNGKTSGTTGAKKRLEAIRINLTSDMAKEYDIYYRTHIQSYGWTGWAKNGAASGSEGLSKRMEALEIRIVKKGSSAPGTTKNTFYKK